MGCPKRKRYLILILAGVILSIAGLLSLLTSPALAAVPPQNCTNHAVQIQTRTEDAKLEADEIGFTENTCRNLCTGNLEHLNSELYRKVPSPDVTILTGFKWTFDSGDELFADKIGGTVAAFCNASAILGAQQPGPDCGGIDLFAICDGPAP